MAYAANFERWNHTSDILAMIANTIPTDDGEGFSRADFHPMLDQSEDESPRRNEISGDPIDYLERCGF